MEAHTCSSNVQRKEKEDAWGWLASQPRLFASSSSVSELVWKCGGWHYWEMTSNYCSMVSMCTYMCTYNSLDCLVFSCPDHIHVLELGCQLQDFFDNLASRLLFDHAITVWHYLALAYALVFHTILNSFSRTLNVLTSSAVLILSQQLQLWGRMPSIKIITSEQFITKITGKHQKETHNVACALWLVPLQLSSMDASPSASKSAVTDTWDLMMNLILTS